MTSPSSYVFYSPGNSSKTRQEGVSLSRVFITENKITLYSKEIVRTAKSGVLFEKILYQTTYSLHKNSKGVKYLKRYNKSAAGSFTDSSLEAVMTGGRYNNVLVSNTADYACRVLIEKTILNWFDLKFKERVIESHKARLLFPAMRDESFPRDEALAKTLGSMQKMTSTVTKALRENSSWEDFILDIGHQSVHTMEDVLIVKDHPNELLPISDIELPPLSALYAKNSEALLNVVSTFTPHDRSLIRFMFKNLPLEARFDAVVTMLTLSKIHLEFFTKDTSIRYFKGYSSLEASLKRIPSKRRGELAEKLLKNFTKKINSKNQVVFQDSFIVTQLSHTFRYWFANEMLESQLETEFSIEDLENLFMELFGIHLPKDGPLLNLHEKRDRVFGSLRMDRLIVPNPQLHYDLVGSLVALGKSVPEKGIGGTHAGLNGYVDENRVFVPVIGALHSIDDIINIFTSAASVIDSDLVRMGRATTPENRLAFLAFRHKERKFKNSWKYYDLGVTDIDKILALKKANITAKRDILTYMELPDEMFYELTAMAAGVDDLEMANAS